MSYVEMLVSLRPEEYELYSQGVKHGSYVIAWARRRDDAVLGRLVSISLTPVPEEPLPESTQLQLEVWAGAQTKERFARHLIAQWDGITLQEMTDVRRDEIKDAVLHAAKRADSLTVRDLTESYLATANSGR